MIQPLDRESPVPLYRQLAAELRRRIEAESLRRLPGLVSLRQQYEVSRPTVEDAVRILADEGLVYVSPGKGTFVRRDGDEAQADEPGA